MQKSAVAIAVILSLVLVSAQEGFVEGEKQETVLAESNFLWDDDGWTLEGNPNGLLHGSKMIKAADEDASVWYFVAPGKFVGAKRAAYKGKLAFRQGFFEYNSEGRDFNSAEYDVILESEAYEMAVGWKHVIPAWAFRSDHELNLDEAAGWVLTSTGGPPSRPDMIRLLSKLSGIKFRGGFYVGNEDSYLMSVKLIAGPQDTAPRKTSLKEQRILSADARAPPPIDDEDTDTIPPPPIDSGPVVITSSSDDDDGTPAPPPPELEDEAEEGKVEL